MSLLNDARRLAEYSDEPSEPHDYHTDFRYVFCGQARGSEHSPDCPWLAMPKIVAALEATERIAAEAPEADGPWCAYCNANIRKWEDSSPISLPHHSDCPWQTLVDTLRDEGVPV